MKLVIQIPCFNEEKTLEKTLNDIPEKINGIDEINILVIDDGSTDKTYEIAKNHKKVTKIIKLQKNQGLAKAFIRGIEEALEMGGDIIVNTDGDNQYKGEYIKDIIKPIIEEKAAVVIGDRQINNVKDFSAGKKVLQKLGSAFVRLLSSTDVTDTTSGFRAFSRESALHMHIFSDYSYTLENILQLSTLGFKIVSVKIKTNSPERKSRLAHNMYEYIIKSTKTIFKLFFIYNPLKLFIPLTYLFGLPGLFLIGRYFYFYFTKTGQTGHVQSLIIGSGLMIISFFMIVVGLIASLISTNRKILESIDYKMKKSLYDNKKK